MDKIKVAVQPVSWLALSLGLLLASPLAAATFYVDQLLDDDGACTPGACSLREAALAANASPGVDVLVLAPGIHELTIPGINEEAGLTGDINFREPVEIRAAYHQSTIIDGNGIDGIFDFFPFRLETEQFVVRGIEFRGGDRSHHRGGAIYGNGGYLLIEECVFDGNIALLGGAISLGNMETTIKNSSFVHNHADSGGAIARTSLGLPLALTIENTTFSGNSASTAGGAIISSRDGVFSLRSSTVVFNTAPSASAFSLVDIGPSGWVVESSIVEGSCNWPGSTFPPTSLGGNVASTDGACYLEHSSDQNVTDFGLGPLNSSENGFVHELLAGSPAIDAATTCPAQDQRGALRPMDGDGDGVPACDAGAFELGSPTGLADVPAHTPLSLLLFGVGISGAAAVILRKR